MNKRGPLLLIDADVLRYQLAFSNTANIDWNGDGNKVEAIQPERAKAKLEDYIDEIVEKFGARDYLLALSCKKHNFRKDIDPTYKLNRASKDKPALWYVLDEFVYDEFGDKIVEIENLEGDDVLGLLASHRIRSARQAAASSCPSTRTCRRSPASVSTTPTVPTWASGRSRLTTLTCSG